MAKRNFDNTFKIVDDLETDLVIKNKEITGTISISEDFFIHGTEEVKYIIWETGGVNDIPELSPVISCLDAATGNELESITVVIPSTTAGTRQIVDITSSFDQDLLKLTDKYNITITFPHSGDDYTVDFVIKKILLG